MFPGRDLGGGDDLGIEIFLVPDGLSSVSSHGVLHLPPVLRRFFSLNCLLNHVFALWAHM